MFKLVIQDDEGKTTVVPLIRDEITIGRKEGNTIRLTERNVSRRHARILRNNGEVQIEDLGSYNGIRVNNARIAERVALRVSDQVQIGDYKLYLKAEGVEQVDEARTVPIERIDAPPTDVMTAVNAAPTAPMAVAAPGAAAPAAARGGMGVADTDPQGRPVASASQVAALTATAAYGRLVVVSSNFAGKEFELTRPQMIVGRTEENDLVVNHRSISRNHAKVTRDPETGRYTISDLQSSNGVRVNGQDYGKVELRRGDTIDLGHVRLRFVEPGEDFVFARDAVIADIPETGSKRGLLVAIVLAVLVLGAVGAFVMMKNKKTSTAGGGTNEHRGSGSGDLVATNVPPKGSDIGSDTQDNPPEVIDAGKVVQNDNNPPPTGDDAARKRMECVQLGTERKWSDMSKCALELKALDPDKSAELVKRAQKETAAEIALGKLNDAIREQDLGKARKIYNDIDDDSLYHKDAKTAFDKFDRTLLEDDMRKARAFAARHKCDELDKLVGQVRDAHGEDNANQVAGVKCTAAVVDNSTHTPPNGGQGSNTGGGTTQTPPAGGGCDPTDPFEKGRKDFGLGTYAAALQEFEAALKCKSDPSFYRFAAMSACKLGNEKKARQYYPKVPSANQQAVAQACAANKIEL
jgi:pSer/pThr/pTyr-binding forkhead associated (FHA) protein